jgi:hypothetical protein
MQNKSKTFPIRSSASTFLRITTTNQQGLAQRGSVSKFWGLLGIFKIFGTLRIFGKNFKSFGIYFGTN